MELIIIGLSTIMAIYINDPILSLFFIVPVTYFGSTLNANEGSYSTICLFAGLFAIGFVIIINYFKNKKQIK